MSPQDFLDQLLPAAIACQRQSGIPASFTLAQAALESAWGASQLAKRGCNLFGVKADRAWTGTTINMDAGEYINGKWVKIPAPWRCYPDWLTCMLDRAAFFRKNPRYADCFKETTGEGWARAVQKAGYATDPAYADKIIGIIHGRNLQRFDHLEAA